MTIDKTKFIQGKDVVVNTNSINCYGSRILTSGIDLSQFKKNPLLLFMHSRQYSKEYLPIGLMELRVENDQLIGTPYFDADDDFAKRIADKWEKGILRMCSGSFEPLETSTAPEHLLDGQRRATVTRSRLHEISIADIGGNDDALQLIDARRQEIKLTDQEDNSFIPLLKSDPAPEPEKKPKGGADDTNKHDQTKKQMEELRKLLGLADDATEQDIIAAIKKLQEKSASAEQVELARITDAVDAKIKLKPELAADRDKLINLGRTAGFESLSMTLGYVGETHKPSDFINLSKGGGQGAAGKKFTELSAQELTTMRTDNREQYIKLYREEFGIDPEL